MNGEEFINIDSEEIWVLGNLYRENYSFLNDKENRNTPHAKYGQNLRIDSLKFYLENPNFDPLEEMKKEKFLKKDKKDWLFHQIIAEIIYEMRGFTSR